MLKTSVNNPRYPHRVRIIRRRESDSVNPMTRYSSAVEETVVYDGRGRSFTDTTTDGDKQVDRNKRKASIPMRFNRWGKSSDGCCCGCSSQSDAIWPMDGDEIEVFMGSVHEYGRVKDFEPDNDRSIIYWEFVRN